MGRRDTASKAIVSMFDVGSAGRAAGDEPLPYVVCAGPAGGSAQ
jgi:hypothetical protein